MIRTCAFAGSLLLLIAATFCSAEVQCWVSLEPGGEAVNWISTNGPLADSRNYAWLNASINPVSTKASFTMIYAGSSADYKLIDRFENPPGLISTPLYMAYTGYLGAQAVFSLIAKDSFSKCLT